MNDRYGEVGKTTTRQISLQNQDLNPLYRTRTPTATPTTVTTSPTTQPTTVSQTTQVTTTPTTLVPSTTITTQIPTPSPTQTQTPGFEGILAGAAIIAGLILYVRKE